MLLIRKFEGQLHTFAALFLFKASLARRNNVCC